MIKVRVRGFDSYYEKFECEEVRTGNYYLWMRLTNGQNRYIPLHQVRWYSRNPESHSKSESEE